MLHATLRIHVLAAACALLPMSMALADDTPPPKPTFTVPMTADFLRQLDNDQLRMLRRATRGCTTVSKAMRPERNPCVTRSTDQAVADSGNVDLQAFHRALPLSERYDENRSTVVWRTWLPKQ